jgi:hypothetical protein
VAFLADFDNGNQADYLASLDGRNDALKLS